MLTKMVKDASAKEQPKDRTVHLDILGLGRGDEMKTTCDAISKMDNDQKQQFAKLLLDTIDATHNRDTVKKQEAELELVALFGKDTLDCEAVSQSLDGFFFSLTAEGQQFRAWYAPFGSVSRNHFDSCGSGCVFSVACLDQKTLREWIAPFVKGKAEWGGYGTVWIGHGPH